MPRQLLSFGDSWPYGAELLEGSKPYGELIAESLNIPHKNYSQPATSVEKLILQLKDAVQSSDVSNSIAIFTITSPTRSIWVDDEHNFHEIHVRNQDPISQAYYKYIWSDDLDHYKINTVVLALQRICQQYNIDDYYVSGFTKIDLNYPGIDSSKIYQTSLTELLNCQIPVNIVNNMDFCVDRQNPFIWPNECHPNQAGHVEIACTLGPWINANTKI